MFIGQKNIHQKVEIFIFSKSRENKVYRVSLLLKMNVKHFTSVKQLIYRNDVVKLVGFVKTESKDDLQCEEKTS